VPTPIPITPPARATVEAMTHDAELILAVGAVLTAGVAVAGLANRLRLPALVLFAGLGMLVGSDGLGWIAFDDYQFARLVGTGALVLILFEGGLAAGWGELRRRRSARRLGIPGVYLVGLGLGDAPLADREAVVAFTGVWR
jgi:NhaP-type Na+/H+ or K+/H+ antiporter